MWLDPALRREASKAREKLQTWAEAFQVSAAASALRAAEAPHDSVAAVLAGWSAVATIMSVASSAAARAKGRLADDPPAEDFQRATHAFRRRLKPREIVALLEPIGEAGEIGLDLGRALFDEAVESGAAVRAFERAQGALIHSAPDMVELRVAEARTHAGRSVELLLNGTDLARRLATSLKSDDERGRLLPPLPQPRVIGGGDDTLADHLSEPTLAALYRAGIRIGELNRPIPVWRIDEPIAGLPNFLREGADVLDEFASTLGEWDPRSDLDRVAI